MADPFSPGRVPQTTLKFPAGTTENKDFRATGEPIRLFHAKACQTTRSVVYLNGRAPALLFISAFNGGPLMKVKEVMHKGVDWVAPDTPLADLAKLMRQHDIGAIPIGENDRLIGMVTDRDIVCKGLAEDGFDARRATARDVMTPGIHCCSEDDDLAKAIRHMEALKVRRLPVLNKGKRMVGILSLGDISHSAPSDLLSECIKSVAAHHH
jgi:CBS domain-containing protein